MTKLPDGSGCFTATILSHEEAMALPPKERPLNYRIPGDLYHAVFEAVGAASMCWNPRPSNEVFDSDEASKVAVDLCFKIADELEHCGYVTKEEPIGDTTIDPYDIPLELLSAARFVRESMRMRGITELKGLKLT
jgi:hypothetical protein